MSEPLATIVGRSATETFVIWSIPELDPVLLQIVERGEPEVPPFVAVVRRDGDTLSIGLGRPYSVLTYIGKNLDPPYFTSVGDMPWRGEVVYYFHGHHTEFATHNAVPLDAAVETVRRFIMGSGLPLPDNVKWEEV